MRHVQITRYQGPGHAMQPTIPPRWIWEYIDALPQWQQAIQETIKRKVQSYFVL